MVFKIILLGNAGVGKSLFVQNLLTITDNKKKIKVDFNTNKYIMDYNNSTFEIYDTKSRTYFESLRSDYYDNVSGIIIIFNPGDKNSVIDDLNVWINELKNNNIYNIPLILLGNNFTNAIDDTVQKDLFEIASKLTHAYNVLFVNYNIKEDNIEILDNLMQNFRKKLLINEKTSILSFDLSKKDIAKKCCFCCNVS